MIYPDASVIVALFRTEPHSAQAKAVLALPSIQRRISDFTVAEVSAALTAQYRGIRKGPADLTRMLAAADAWFGASGPLVAVLPADIQTATSLVRRLDLRLRVPDALHVAICRRLGATLLTFDRDQTAAATALGIALAA